MPSLSERVAAARQTETQEISSTRSDALGELRGRLHFKVVEELGPTLYDRQTSDAELRLRVLEMLEWAVDQEQGLPLTSADRRALLNEIASDVLGYGPIDPLLNDPDVTEVMANGLHVILGDEQVKSVFVNVFGGITACDEVANGIVKALEILGDEATKPLVVRLDGNNVVEGRRILDEANHPLVTMVDTMDDAAAKAAELAK